MPRLIPSATAHLRTLMGVEMDDRHDRRGRHGTNAPVRIPADRPETRDPDVYLSRIELSDELEELGLPCAAATLATMAVRGGGPEYVKFGPYARYRRGTGHAWARSRVSAPRTTTAETDAA
jgi:hypothetical protein